MNLQKGMVKAYSRALMQSISDEVRRFNPEYKNEVLQELEAETLVELVLGCFPNGLIKVADPVRLEHEASYEDDPFQSMKLHYAAGIGALVLCIAEPNNHVPRWFAEAKDYFYQASDDMRLLSLNSEQKARYIFIENPNKRDFYIDLLSDLVDHHRIMLNFGAELHLCMENTHDDGEAIVEIGYALRRLPANPADILPEETARIAFAIQSLAGSVDSGLYAQILDHTRLGEFISKD